jgi:hypothetical protein
MWSALVEFRSTVLSALVDACSAFKPTQGKNVAPPCELRRARASTLAQRVSTGNYERTLSTDLGVATAKIFPWGDNRPTRRQRFIVALVVTLISTATLYASFVQDPARKTDFGLSWFSARAMVQHRDPYSIVGPGREYFNAYPLYYPATAFVAATPFSVLPENLAALTFVAVSVFLLMWGMTADSWHRLPLVVSASFMDSVLAAQWTIVLTAALFLPWLAALMAAKPQSGLPVVAAGNRKTLFAAAIGAVILVLVSFLFLPHWPRAWLANLSSSTALRPPLFNPVGMFVVLVLLRWRRPEAWLVFLMACLPQTFMWYSALALLAVGATYREASMLSLISTTGFLLGNLAIYKGVSHLGRVAWMIYIASTFIPPVIVILRRRNERKSPAWLEYLVGRRVG